MPGDDPRRKSSRSHATGGDICAGMPAFPGESPSPLEAAEHMEALSDRAADLHLQAIVANKLPLRVQHLRNWPDDMLTIPADVRAAADPVKIFELQARIADKQRENEGGQLSGRARNATPPTICFVRDLYLRSPNGQQGPTHARPLSSRVALGITEPNKIHVSSVHSFVRIPLSRHHAHSPQVGELAASLPSPGGAWRR